MSVKHGRNKNIKKNKRMKDPVKLAAAFLTGISGLTVGAVHVVQNMAFADKQ